MPANGHDPVVIASFARTPMGGFQGALSGAQATELGAAAVKAALERAGVSPDQVQMIFMGNVLPAGIGEAPATRAAGGAAGPARGGRARAGGPAPRRR